MIFKKKNKDEIYNINEIIKRIEERDETLTGEEMDKVALYMYERSKKSTNKFRTFIVLITPLFIFQIITTNIKPVLFISMFMLMFNGYQLGLCNKWDYINEEFLKDTRDLNEFMKQKRSTEEMK